MANANADLLRNYNKTQFFGEGKAASDVRVVGFANDALYGITAAINEQSRQVSDFSNSLDDANDTINKLLKEYNNTTEQQRKDEKAKDQRAVVASQASERNTRARNLALTGEIKKATSVIDLAKKSLDKLLGYVGNIANKYVSSLESSIDSQRRLALSTQQIANNQIAANKVAASIGNKYGIVAEDARKVTDLLAEQGLTSDSLTQKQLESLTIATTKNGIPFKQALDIVRSIGKSDEEQLKYQKTLVKSMDTTGRLTFNKTLEAIPLEVQKMIMSNTGKSEAEFIDFISEQSRMLDSYFGEYMTAESQASLLAPMVQLQANLVDQVTKDQDVMNKLVGVGITGNDPTAIVQQIFEGLRADRFNEKQLQVLSTIPGISKDLLNELANMQRDANRGDYKFKEIHGEEENQKRMQDMITGGVIPGWINNIFANLDASTGNIFTKFTVEVRRLFGESVSTVDVIKGTFGALSAIVPAISNFIMGSRIKDSADTAKKTLNSINSNGKEIVKAIKKLGTQLSGKNKLGKASGDASSNGDSKSKKKTVSSEASSKSSSKSQKQTTKKAPSKSSKALLGVGLGLGGIGAAAGVVGLLGSMGVFDSLKPMFEDFSKSVLPTIKTAVDTLAPTIDGILKQVAPVINDLLKSFGPVLKDVLDSLMPLAKDLMGFLINILNPLLPVVKTIIKSVVPILKDVFEILAPVLTDVVEVVSSVLQPLAALLKPIFNALKPVLKPLTEIFIKFNPFIIALQVVAKGVTAIAKKFGYDIEKEQREEEEKARREQSEKTRRETLAGYSNDELIKILETLALTKGNEGIANNLDFLTTQSKSDLIDTITSASTGYAGAADILDDDFNKLLKASKSGTAESNELLKQINDNLTGKKKSDEEARKKEEAQRKKDDQTLNAFQGALMGSAFGIPGAAIGGVAGYFKDQVVGGLINWLSPKARANGGVVDKPTTALVGEAGKEVIFPLTKPDKLREVLLQLSSNEKLLLLKSLLKSDHSLSILEWSDILYNILSTSNKRVPTKNSSGSMTSSIPYSGDSYESAVKALESYRGGRLKPAEFVKLFGPIAREDMRRSGIPASVTLAQAALETGWGKTAHADFRNLFGIKGSGDAGSKVVNTHEVYDGVSVKKKDAFAQYSSYLASIEAHSKYLLNAKRKSGLNGLRYGEALTHIFEPNLFAYLLREGGYATSTSYGAKLVGLMRNNDLYKYDLPVGSLALQDVGPVQRELISLAENNALNSTKSQERLNALREEEYQREVIRAIKENKAPPSRKSFMSVFGSGATPDLASTSAPSVADVPSISKVGLLSTSDIQSIMHEAGINNSSSVAQYVEQANKVLGSTASKEDIMMVLYEIARYLKGIYSSPANRPSIVPVARPNEYTYGVSVGAR